MAITTYISNNSENYIKNPSFVANPVDTTGHFVLSSEISQPSPETKLAKLETRVNELTQVVETLQEMLTELIERSEKPKAKKSVAALQEEVEKMLRARAEMEKFADEQREAKRQSLLSQFQGMGITDPERLLSK